MIVGEKKGISRGSKPYLNVWDLNFHVSLGAFGTGKAILLVVSLRKAFLIENLKTTK